MVLVWGGCETPLCFSGLGSSVTVMGGGRMLLVGYMVVEVTLPEMTVFQTGMRVVVIGGIVNTVDSEMRV